MRTSSPKARMVPRPGDLVKAKIIEAGLSLADVAKETRIARSTLSDYLAGRIRNIHGQINIMLAFCELTGKTMTVRAFWGELTAREVS